MRSTLLGSAIARVSYPGCGILAGKSADGSNAVLAFFLMGRSPVSKNRVFIEDGGGVRTEPFYTRAARNESLLIYQPVLAFANKLIIGNGAHTENAYQALIQGKTFEEVLAEEMPLNDPPHYTPRLTALASMNGEDFGLKMSVVKRLDDDCTSVCRSFFSYDNVPAGVGFYLHTYECDADPLPPVNGEPIQVKIDGSIFDIVADIWENMNAENKVSLWVRTIDLNSHKSMSRIINKNR